MCQAIDIPPPPSLSVLHLVGSSETRFYFECSFLYAKNACRFEREGVKNYYALLLPDGPGGPGRVALLEDEIPSQLSADDVLEGAADGIAMVSLAEFLGLIGRGPTTPGCYFRHPVQLLVPHMFDNAGMTTWRMLAEDVLRLPVAGMPGVANVFAQDKVATRLVLGQSTAKGGRSPIPKGFAVRRRDLPSAVDGRAAPLIERVRAEVGGFPVMLKSPLEDNSRGLYLVGRGYAEKKKALGDDASEEAVRELEIELETELSEKLEDVFGYGDGALFEEFIPGREFRCGAIELRKDLDAYRQDADATAHKVAAAPRLTPIPVMVEYVMMNPKMPIRTAADKLSKGDKGQMVMTKCTRRYVSSHPNKQGGDDDDEYKVHPIEAKLQEEIESLVERAHEALGCGVYSLFDIRVDDRDPSNPRPYIIECCAFWSFTPKSALSLLLTASGIDYERVVLDMWTEKALGMEEAAKLVSAGPGLKLVSAGPGTKAANVDAVVKTDPPAACGVTHRLRAATHMLAVASTAPLLLSYILRQYLSLPPKAGDDAVPDAAPAHRRTVLVTGGKMAKSLFVARALWRAGHRVVLVETDKYWCSGSRLSRAVWAFATVADPRTCGETYLKDLERVFEKYECDTFMPVSSPFSARFDAMFLRGKQGVEMQLLDDTDESDGSDEDSTTKESAVTTKTKEGARNLHFEARVCDILDDKHSFWKYCTETLGLPSSAGEQDSDGGMLPSHRFSSDDEVLALNKQLQEAGTKDKYVLKNLGYDPLHRLDLFCLPADGATVTNYLEKIRADGNGISKDEPWQAQLFIEKGVEMSCFAVLRDSRLELFTCALSSASQLRYVHAGEASEGATEPNKRNAGHTPLIDAQAAACRKWVNAFCAALREKDECLDGQLCWDFMCTGEGSVRAFPLECNPRVHSQSAVFGASNGDQRRFGEALVGDSVRKEVLVPGMATDAEAETHFWGWWANEFYSRQDTSLMLRLLGMLYAFVSGVCSLLGLSHGRGARVFNYTQASDENATWYTNNFSFKDSDFDAEDPLPFLGRNLLQPLVLFWGVLLSGNEWTKYDFCIGKVVEKNGD